MQILRVDIDRPDPKAIEEAVGIMMAGGVIIYPTDTCYGLGADITNSTALHKISRIKGRDEDRPISMIVKSVDYIKRMSYLDPRMEQVLRDHLPGPFTFLVPNSGLHSFPHPKIGVRIPDCGLTRVLADWMPVPYATTSANYAEAAPAYSIEEMHQTLLTRGFGRVTPDLILDAGPLRRCEPSAIVDLTGWPPEVIREGEKPIDWKKYE